MQFDWANSLIMKTILVVVGLVLALQATIAHANGKHPLDYSLREYAFLLLLSLLGGFVAFHQKVRTGKVQAWNLTHLVGELTTSAFSGMLVFWLCEAAGLAPLYTASLSGIGGYMGTRALTLIENWAIARKLPLRRQEDRVASLLHSDESGSDESR
jgi:hypothetical protein